MRIDPGLFLLRRSGVFRAVFVAAVAASLLWPVSSFAQRRLGPSPLDTLGQNPSQEDGWEVLRKFRSLGLAGDYSFRFQLRVMPRKGKTRAVSGLMYGTMNELGPLSRVDVVLAEASVGPQAELVPARVHRLLLQNGLFARAMESRDEVADGVPQMVPTERYFEPIADSDFTVFDLLMPYTYWQSFRYEGRTTFRGRPSHVFWLYPPENDAFLRERLSGVRIHLDEEFYALIQAEIFDAEEKLAKTVTIVDFKKVDDQWILSQVDVRDDRTRDKTRFKVTDASMNLELPESVFTAPGLAENVYGAALPAAAAE